MAGCSNEIGGEERYGTDEEDSKTSESRVVCVFLAKELVGSQEERFGAEKGHNEATVQNVGSLLIEEIFFQLIFDGREIKRNTRNEGKDGDEYVVCR